MIPLRDTNPTTGTPGVTYAIIGTCAATFLFQLALGRDLAAFLILYGIVPARYSDPGIAAHFSALQQALPFLSSMFLHGGWLHIIGNMWVLYIFGDNVESALGHGRYLFFYLACGVLAGVFHVLTNLDSRIPTIGASGAIAGVMGAYFILYPRARILALIPLFIFWPIIEVPAYVFLALWFAMQFFSGTASVGSGGAASGGVAWWAHVGGFLAGVGLVKVMGVRRRGSW